MILSLPIFVLFLSYLSSRHVFRDALHPVVLFIFINFAATFFPVVLAPDFFASLLAVCFLAAFSLSLLGGALFARYMRQEKGKVSEAIGIRVGVNFDEDRLRYFFIICSCASLLSGIYILYDKGLTGVALLSIDAIVDVASSVAIDRYADEIPAPALSRFLVTLGYLGALVSGFTYGSVRRLRVLRYLPLLGVLGFSIATTARAPLIYAGILWAAGMFSASVLVDSDRRRFKLKSILLIIFLAFGLFVFFVTLQAVRGGSLDIETAVSQFDRMRVWFLGYLGGFSVWIDAFDFVDQFHSMGAYTFAGVFDALGIAERRIGIYSDFVAISPEYSTNIFTAYRSLIMDFGVPFALVAAAFAGALGDVAYLNARRGRVYWCVVLQAYYCYMLWVFITSFFAYNLLLAVFPLMVVSLKFFMRKHR